MLTHPGLIGKMIFSEARRLLVNADPTWPDGQDGILRRRGGCWHMLTQPGLIGKMIFSEERKLLAHADPTWPDRGDYILRREEAAGAR
jgi:hypothetical protein